MSCLQTESTGVSIRELTIRGVVTGGMITIIFTAANVYLGLRADLTLATSVPTAVISMATLRYFKDHSVQGNNIVRTIASTTGTLPAIIFTLPGLAMTGWWQGFPYWQSVAVIALSRVLSVMYSTLLCRALVTHSDLPYPEGVAAAEVLRVDDSIEGEEESRRGLLAIIKGAVTSSGFTILSSAKAVGTGIDTVFTVGAGGTMASASLSFVLLGVGHLVGIAVGITMIAGLLISYGMPLPMRSQGLVDDPASASELVLTIFRSGVRLIGAGAIAVAVVWTLFKLLVPIIDGIRDSLASSSRRTSGEVLPPNEQGLSGKVVVGMTIGSMLPIEVLLWLFLRGTPLMYHWIGLILVSVLFTLITGLAVTSVCGYMAGLVSVSDSPISGVGILMAVAAALMVKAVHSTITDDELSVLVAYTLFTVALVLGITTISNGSLQGLKTEQLVGATPWKQQLALIIGVSFGVIVILPILNLMYRALGFQGIPGAGRDALAAPQTFLISGLIKGVSSGDLNWGLLGADALIGMIVIIIDEVFKRATRRLSLPDLAVGVGIYLPMTITIVIPIGTLLGPLHDQWAGRQTDPEEAKRMGTFVAMGLIVGESLWSVIYVGIVGFSDEDTPLALFGESFATPARQIDTILFIAAATYLYKDMRSGAKAHWSGAHSPRDPRASRLPTRGAGSFPSAFELEGAKAAAVPG